jgi:hypothetical protein
MFFIRIVFCIANTVVSILIGESHVVNMQNDHQFEDQPKFYLANGNIG